MRSIKGIDGIDRIGISESESKSNGRQAISNVALRSATRAIRRSILRGGGTIFRAFGCEGGRRAISLPTELTTEPPNIFTLKRDNGRWSEESCRERGK